MRTGYFNEDFKFSYSLDSFVDIPKLSKVVTFVPLNERYITKCDYIGYYYCYYGYTLANCLMEEVSQSQVCNWNTISVHNEQCITKTLRSTMIETAKLDNATFLIKSGGSLSDLLILFFLLYIMYLHKILNAFVYIGLWDPGRLDVWISLPTKPPSVRHAVGPGTILTDVYLRHGKHFNSQRCSSYLSDLSCSIFYFLASHAKSHRILYQLLVSAKVRIKNEGS